MVKPVFALGLLDYAAKHHDLFGQFAAGHLEIGGLVGGVRLQGQAHRGAEGNKDLIGKAVGERCGSVHAAGTSMWRMPDSSVKPFTV